MCIPDGTLRAKLDGELGEAAVKEVTAHLDRCPRCRERAEAIAESAGRVRTLFADFAPDEAQADAAAAFARLESRRSAQPARATLLDRLFARRFAPAWAAAMAAVLVAVLAMSAPGRVFAQKILSILRVNAVVAVPIEHTLIDASKGQMLQQVLAESVVTTKESRRVAAASRADASRLAGYDVLLPGLRQDAPQLTVNTEHAFQFTANQQRLETLLAAVGRTDLALPPNLDGAKVVVDAAPAVEARYGDCPSGKGWREAPPADIDTCLTFTQAPSPTVVTVPELNLQAIAEFGLQLAGMTAAQARTFSQTIDWTSTLAVPIPRDAATYQTVSVNGAQGILITTLGPASSKLPPGYAVLWARNGMIYSLAGFGNPSQAVSLGESLR